MGLQKYSRRDFVFFYLEKHVCRRGECEGEGDTGIECFLGLLSFVEGFLFPCFFFAVCCIRK